MSDATRLSDGKKRRVRLLAFMRQHGRATANDLAELTGASIRTIYRDLTELQEYGLPIIAKPGDGFLWRGAREVAQ